MQVFDREPSEDDLRPFAATGRRAVMVRLTAGPRELRGDPAGIPRWLVLAAMGPVAAVMAYAWAGGWRGPPMHPVLWWLGLAATVTAFAAVLLVTAAINRDVLAAGPFFTLDRRDLTLTLHREGVVLCGPEVGRLVLTYCYGWERVSPGEDENGTELSVLARGPGGSWRRYSVVFTQDWSRTARLGRQLRDLFGVPLDVVHRR